MKAKNIRWIFAIGLIQVSAGCSLLSDLSSLNNRLNGGTGSVDAIEGDVKQDERGIINALRSREDAEEGDPNWTPIPPASDIKHYSAVTGSLFSLALAEDLYDDTKPRRIGDIVTVLLEENTQAKKAASADTNKSNNLSLNPIELGGQIVTVGGNNSNLSYALSNDNKTSGSTSADQSNSINGSISVEVIEVLANGNLVVRGEKWLTLNTGDEYIRLSGTVRPDDISPENTIASTRISNAKIRYSATGDRQDIQQESWLARFFNVIL